MLPKRQRATPPPHELIAKAQGDIVSTLDVEAPERTCWACGMRGESGEALSWLERAHVKAHSSGGSTEPGNFLLLCHSCHREQPDAAPRDAQIAWLRAHESFAERTRREWEPLFQAAKEEFPSNAKLGIAIWFRDLGYGALVALWEKYEKAPGGRLNGKASAIWGVVSEFRAWAAA
jgi:hypothetical protein